MARQEFLDTFRVARNLFLHPQAEANRQQTDPKAAAERLARAAIWLAPNSVKGFNPDDFPELGPDRQRELQAAAQDFLAVAREVPRDSLATPEQYGKAAAPFRKMVEILQPYVATPDEGSKVVQVLRSQDLPAWVLNWDYELGSDHEGDPMVVVTLFVDWSAATPMEIARFASQLNQKLIHALPDAGVRRWPHIRVRTAEEHKSL